MATQDAVSLLPDRLGSLRGFVLETVLNDGAENAFVVGACLIAVLWCKQKR